MAQLLHALTLAAGLLVSSPAPLTADETVRVQALIRAYPDFLSHVEGRTLVWRDGTRMLLTRSTATSYTERLNTPGLLDQLAVPYPACAPIRTPAWNVDPGRTRFEPLFRRMYGGTAAQVQRNLRPVNWFGQSVQVTRVNGVDRSLQAVAAELARSPELRPFLTPSAGTFLWRTVAGTPRLSVHSFGAAIDLNVARSSYWAWNGYREGQQGITYRNAFPLKVVQVFERHGWIWGGRWYHHDTMHFEYRPELTGAEACQNRWSARPPQAAEHQSVGRPRTVNTSFTHPWQPDVRGQFGRALSALAVPQPVGETLEAFTTGTARLATRPARRTYAQDY